MKTYRTMKMLNFREPYTQEDLESIVPGDYLIDPVQFVEAEVESITRDDRDQIIFTCISKSEFTVDEGPQGVIVQVGDRFDWGPNGIDLWCFG